MSDTFNNDDLTTNPDQMYVHESGVLMVPQAHPDCVALLRLQLENIELAHWKSQLKARINAERSDVLRLKELLNAIQPEDHQEPLNQSHHPSIIHNHQNYQSDGLTDDQGHFERIVQHYMKENALLEQKKQLLVREVFDEHIELIQLQVDLAVQNFKY